MDITKEDKIIKLIDDRAENISNIPIEIIDQFKKNYLTDNRSYEDIEKEILSIFNEVKSLEELVKKDIKQDVLENSIILIGPMGSGKSTISSLLSNKYNMPSIALDDRQRLSSLYEKEREFNYFKDFEFFLTSSVLTSLKEPTIVDFGAGHSVYENQIMFLEIKALISKFSNVVLLMPSEDKEESITLLNENKGIIPGSDRESANRHFVNISCNYSLATITEYTKGKTEEQVSNEIIQMINQKKESNDNTTGKAI